MDGTAKTRATPITLLLTLAIMFIAPAAQTQTIPASITTPDKVESRLGTLEFKDAVPTDETFAKVSDNLDFVHAFDTFVNTMQGVTRRQSTKVFKASESRIMKSLSSQS